MRNTILLSLLLRLTWIVGLFPTFAVQEYIYVILNASTGLYILAYSVVVNRQVRGEVRERLSTRISEMVSTITSEEHSSGGGSNNWHIRKKQHQLKKTHPETKTKCVETE